MATTAAIAAMGVPILIAVTAMDSVINRIM
jgi:hypothetical protein